MATDSFNFELQGIVFKRGYLIYIIEVIHNSKGRFYYIGQTGDRNHKTARPAFRRFAAHLLDQGSSTQNQVYRQIAVKILDLENAKIKTAFTDDIKQQVEDFLVDSKIKVHVYPIQIFKGTTTSEEHGENRSNVEKVEKTVIQYFIKTFGEEKILNKDISNSGQEISREIKKWIDEQVLNEP